MVPWFSSIIHGAVFLPANYVWYSQIPFEEYEEKIFPMLFANQFSLSPANYVVCPSVLQASLSEYSILMEVWQGMERNENSLLSAGFECWDANTRILLDRKDAWVLVGV